MLTTKNIFFFFTFYFAFHRKTKTTFLFVFFCLAMGAFSFTEDMCCLQPSIPTPVRCFW